MSKIKFEHISENEVAVVIDSNVPLDMVEQLTKSLEARGMVEDKANSSVTHRFFYRTNNKADDIADMLIKSLKVMAKDEEESPYSKESRRRTNERNRINDRRSAAGLPSMTDAQIAAKKPAAPAPAAPAAPSGPATLPGVPNKLVDTRNVFKKDDEDEDEIEKSNYGPKGAKLYNPADNAKRKANNMDPVGQGPNVNAKSYSSKPGQLSAKASADLTARIQNKANKKQPVKTMKDMSPEEIKAIKERHETPPLKKAWAQHNPFPSAEEEIMRLARVDQTQVGEDALANQLASMMQGKAMLGNRPPAQPTDEQMFGHLVVTEEMAKAQEQKWQGAAFNWLAEAAKPISQKFASEEEELAYWSSIKVQDRDDGKSGY